VPTDVVKAQDVTASAAEATVAYKQLEVQAVDVMLGGLGGKSIR
jgi:hypothetical protein